MRRAAFLVLALGTALSACGMSGGEQEATVHEREAARANEIAAMDAWDRIFDAPDQTIGFVNQYGYRAAPYGPAEDGSGFAATGAEIPISDTFAAKPNSTTFRASGSTADAIETLVFTLTITDLDDAATAKKRFGDILVGFFSQYGIDLEAEIRQGVTEEASAATEAPGAALQFDKQEIAGAAEGSRRLIVTITRTGGTAPATQETEAQGIDDGNRS